MDSANKVATNSADINMVAAQKAFVISIVAVRDAGYRLEVA